MCARTAWRAGGPAAPGDGGDVPAVPAPGEPYRGAPGACQARGRQPTCLNPCTYDKAKGRRPEAADPCRGRAAFGQAADLKSGLVDAGQRDFVQLLIRRLLLVRASARAAGRPRCGPVPRRACSRCRSSRSRSARLSGRQLIMAASRTSGVAISPINSSASAIRPSIASHFLARGDASSFANTCSSRSTWPLVCSR